MQPWKHSSKHLSDLPLFKHLLQESESTIRGKWPLTLFSMALLYMESYKKACEVGHGRRALLQETKIAYKWNTVFVHV